MEPRAYDVSDAQLAILQELWEKGPSTVRQLTDALYPPGNEAQYATVQTLLKRLEGHGHVRRDRSAHAHVFFAVTELDAIVGYQMRQMAEKLCGGVMAPLLTHLLRAETLTDDERKQLRDLMDQLENKAKPKRRR